MSRDYPRLGLVDFSRHLLSSGDLDPVYVALTRMTWDSDAQLSRWLVAYCAFYHCGVACYMSERDGDFWACMMTAAQNVVPAPDGGRWPRAKERRHFRGGQAMAGIGDWMRRWPEPEDMFDFIAHGATPRADRPEGGYLFAHVRNRALSHLSVGEWLSFKMVDLVDAVLRVPVDQSDAAPFLYDAPVQAMLRFWREAQGLPAPARPLDPAAAVRNVTLHLLRELRDLSPPHKPGEAVDLFCIETCACKWGSHMNGHYPLYNDIDEISHGMQGWLINDTAQRFLAAMPRRPT